MAYGVVDVALSEVVNGMVLEVVSMGTDVVDDVLVVEVSGPGRPRTLVRSPTPGMESVGRSRVGLHRMVRRKREYKLWLCTHRSPRAPNTSVKKSVNDCDECVK